MAPNRRSGPSSSDDNENPDVATVIAQQLQAIITQVANNANNANNDRFIVGQDSSATQPTTIQTTILRAGILTDEAVSCGTLTKGSDKRKGVDEPSKTGVFAKRQTRRQRRNGRNNRSNGNQVRERAYNVNVNAMEAVQDPNVVTGITKALKSAKENELKLNDISVVREFEDVFLEDLSRLPPQGRQEDFA
ncbi:hypothetical protein Tco_1346250 [Tanacetum coccineum]